MEYCKSNRFPKHGSDFMGAILRINNLTKKECFKRKLFGLPIVFSDFVRQIKIGMILFLFEPDERKLYGVFQATSDGAMNIVPSAFSIANKCFPAQVRFERLCACKPLLEDEFSEAIEVKYLTSMKFPFALSCQQVCRLIWLFSSKSSIPFNHFRGVVHNDITKAFEIFNLARTRVNGNESLPKFSVTGCDMGNIIEPARNIVSPGYSKNHLTSYQNYGLHDITPPNMFGRQHEYCCTVSQPSKTQQPDQTLITSHNDVSREAILVTSVDHPCFSSSKFLCKQPSASLDMDFLEHKLNFSKNNSLNVEKPHVRNQCTPAHRLGIKDFSLTDYPGLGISENSTISEPSQQTLHSPIGHVKFPDFSQKPFPESYDLYNNKYSFSPPGRLQNMTSTSPSLRNAQSYCRSIQQEDPWSGPDCSSGPPHDYIPIPEDETFANFDCHPVLEGENIINIKEAHELQSRKEALTLQHDYYSGFANETKKRVNGSPNFSCNNKNSASHLNIFSRSHVIPKRCNVFSRLSRPPKVFKYPSLHRVVKPYHRSQRTKACRQFEPMESCRIDVPLDDNINELDVLQNDSRNEMKAQIEKFDESNEFQFPNFKRRSVVKQPSTGANDSIECVDKRKKRKLIRPSFNEDDSSSQAKENDQNLDLLYTAGSPDTVHNGHDDENISSTSSNAGINGSVNFQNCIQASSTDSMTVNIHGSQHTLDCKSEISNKITLNLVEEKESEKISSSFTLMCDNIDGKLHETLHALPEENTRRLTQVGILQTEQSSSMKTRGKQMQPKTATNSLDSDWELDIVEKMDA